MASTTAGIQKEMLQITTQQLREEFSGKARWASFLPAYWLPHSFSTMQEKEYLVEAEQVLAFEASCYL